MQSAKKLTECRGHSHELKRPLHMIGKEKSPAMTLFQRSIRLDSA